MHTRKCPHWAIFTNLDKFGQLKSGQIGSNDFPEIWHGERSQLKLPPTYCWLSPPFAFQGGPGGPKIAKKSKKSAGKK